ncbi:MAG: hypothetical protein IRZ31_17945 [Thermogemmatispora sp.]|uniref:hypothetical protein n=1 Tax=Thermogemmatispora sp. TaxID=1968838 RepID=UPI0026026831|nr:hypothetical protein [Thermogemmatispora sp.]MBX5458778.1 hypothetical protein [Thermogemmatispora sp.]
MAAYQISDQDYEGLTLLKQQLEQQLLGAESKYMAAVFNRLHRVVSREYIKATRARELMARTEANKLLEKLRAERRQPRSSQEG